MSTEQVSNAPASTSTNTEKYIVSRPWSVSRIGMTFATGKLIEFDKASNKFSVDGKTYDGGAEITVAMKKYNKAGQALLIPIEDKQAKSLLRQIQKRVASKKTSVSALKLDVVNSEDSFMKTLDLDMKGVVASKVPTKTEKLPEKLEVVQSQGVVLSEAASKKLNKTAKTGKVVDLDDDPFQPAPKMQVVSDSDEKTIKFAKKMSVEGVTLKSQAGIGMKSGKGE